MKNTFITIITPTYNRKNQLIKLADSLINQTNQSFQWLIIDDGSTDGTERILERIPKGKFTVKYYRKENGGKHTALNYSHQFIKGDYVCIVDSDDTLTPNAINEINNAIKKYGDNKKIGCISFPRGATVESPFNQFLGDDTIANHIDFRINKKRGGDCFEVLRTQIFTSISFPEHKGETFMSEGYLWMNVAKKYDTVYINKVIYISKYLDGGLTRSGRSLRIRCPLGGMDNSNAYLAKNKKAKLKLKYKIKQSILFDCYSLFANYSMREAIKKCNNSLLALLCYPLGYALHMYWKNKYDKGIKL